MAKAKYHSVIVTKLFMQLIGFWPFRNARHQKIADFALINMFLALSIIAVVESLEFTHCCTDFNVSIQKVIDPKR